jgi:CheY-like chemotaxis protein
MSPTRGRRPMDILLVESHPGDTRLIQEMFASSRVPFRFTVESVSTLEDGIAAIRKRDFDVVLLDMDLPGNTPLLPGSRCGRPLVQKRVERSPFDPFNGLRLAEASADRIPSAAYGGG